MYEGLIKLALNEQWQNNYAADMVKHKYPKYKDMSNFQMKMEGAKKAFKNILKSRPKKLIGGAILAAAIGVPTYLGVKAFKNRKKTDKKQKKLIKKHKPRKDEWTAEIIKKFKKTGKPAQSVGEAALKGLGAQLVSSGLTLGLAPLGSPISSGWLQYNQNKALKDAVFSPKAIKSGEINRPMHPAVAYLVGGGMHGFGIQRQTRHIHDYIRRMPIKSKKKKKGR